MINPDDIKAGMVLSVADVMILRAAVLRLNNLEMELLSLRKAFSEPRGYEWVNGDGEVVSLLTHNPKAGDWSEQYWGDRKFRAIPPYRKPK